jgi:hypothetical protein
MRPRAGNAWTAVFRNGRLIPLIFSDSGKWITTGEAKGWRRCSRCRKPYELDPFESGVCSTCYFHKMIPAGTFWSYDKHPLFPYNIGDRFRESLEPVLADLDKAKDWRRALRERQAQS